MDNFINPELAKVFDNFPQPARQKLMSLSHIILQTAFESDRVMEIDETIKWGEPAYLAKNGSTIRIGWKAAIPDQYALYFHCKTRLVETFRELYGDTLRFEGNRAIVFNMQDPLPLEILKHGILLALTYHRRKNKPLLGV